MHPALIAADGASVESCLAHLHGDLRFYTTAMFADDVNQVLGALHYARANLIGISYGTTAEQVFLAVAGSTAGAWCQDYSA